MNKITLKTLKKKKENEEQKGWNERRKIEGNKTKKERKWIKEGACERRGKIIKF